MISKPDKGVCDLKKRPRTICRIPAVFLHTGLPVQMSSEGSNFPHLAASFSLGWGLVRARACTSVSARVFVLFGLGGVDGAGLEHRIS